MSKSMRNFLLILMITGLAFVFSCRNLTPPLRVEHTAPEKPRLSETDHEDDVPRITLADAKKEYDAGNAVIVDVRDENSYKQEHIAGAINITTQTLEANIDKIPKGKKIIAYCS